MVTYPMYSIGGDVRGIPLWYERNETRNGKLPGLLVRAPLNPCTGARTVRCSPFSKPWRRFSVQVNFESRLSSVQSEGGWHTRVQVEAVIVA